MIKLYKRNAKSQPIFWNIQKDISKGILVQHGIVGKNIRFEHIATMRDVNDEIASLVASKRKEGYKELRDLYDNAPEYLDSNNLYDYLSKYLPKYNTHEDGRNIPMLCKTLVDNKPFEKHEYIGNWKINGERCIIGATKTNDLFCGVKLTYRSREGVDWTDKLTYLDDYIVPLLQGEILDMMVEEDIELDGELYIPGYNINDINSFIKNKDLPQHYQLQYWCYDMCIDTFSAIDRQVILANNLYPYVANIHCKEDHLYNKDRFLILPYTPVNNITEATEIRDKFIDLGFEGLVIRNISATYQFGGRRNNAMLKYKRKEDGIFEIIDIKEDKRGLPIFTLKNDINDETFDATLNATQEFQRSVLNNKEQVILTNLALVEYRERSGVKQVPFHAKIIKFVKK